MAGCAQLAQGFDKSRALDHVCGDVYLAGHPVEESQIQLSGRIVIRSVVKMELR